MDDRPFVFVMKSDKSRDRCGYSSGKTHEEARDRFIKTRRQPSSGQFDYEIPFVLVTIGTETRLYGAESEGFPLKQFESMLLTAIKAEALP